MDDPNLAGPSGVPTIDPGQVLPPRSTPIAARHVLHTEDLEVHSHAFMELAIVVDGTATHVSAAGSRVIDRGSVIGLRPGEWHGYQDCQDLRIIDVYIGPELFARELAWLAEDSRLGAVLRPPRPGHVTLASGEVRVGCEAVTRMDRWCADLAAADPAATQDRATKIGNLLLILGEVAATLSPAMSAGYLPATAHPSVLQAVRLMEEQLSRGWTLASLAREVNLAPAYLVRLFGRHLGLPPISYLNRIRAERAGVLLIETDLPVAAIGARVGWTDPTYVSRRFKACFAMSPARYRSAFRAR